MNSQAGRDMVEYGLFNIRHEQYVNALQGKVPGKLESGQLSPAGIAADPHYAPAHEQHTHAKLLPHLCETLYSPWVRTLCALRRQRLLAG